MDLRAQLGVVRRHLIMVIVAILVAGVGAGLIAHRRVPQYTAQALVQLTPSGSGNLFPTTATDLTGPSAVQAQILTLPSSAIAAAKLAAHPPKGSPLTRGLHITAADWPVLQAEISASGDSNGFLYINATDANPVYAADYANAFAYQYVTSVYQTQLAGYAQTVKIQNGLIAKLKSQEGTVKGSGNKEALQVEINAAQQAVLTAQTSQALAPHSKLAVLLNPASPPDKAGGTPLVESILFGAIAGLLIGIGGAFLREQLDDRMRTRDDAADSADGLPILAEAPVDRRAIRRIRDDGIAAAMTTRLGETARALRTAIMFLGVHREVRRILVTSAEPGAGKTLTSALLATAYAQAGFRTILISADLRQPRLEQLLGIVPRQDRGLTEALLWSPRSNLRGGADARVREVDDYLASQIDQTIVPNLSLLSSGPLPPNPGELLSSQRMEDLLGHLAVSYDMLIVDSAPLVGLSDSRVLASMVDGLVLVTAVGQGKRSIQAARETLQAADVHWLGLVVNKAPGVQNSPYGQVQSRPARRRRHAAESLGRPGVREVNVAASSSRLTEDVAPAEPMPAHETISER